MKRIDWGVVGFFGICLGLWAAFEFGGWAIGGGVLAAMLLLLWLVCFLEERSRPDWRSADDHEHYLDEVYPGWRQRQCDR